MFPREWWEWRVIVTKNRRPVVDIDRYIDLFYPPISRERIEKIWRALRFLGNLCVLSLRNFLSVWLTFWKRKWGNFFLKRKNNRLQLYSSLYSIIWPCSFPIVSASSLFSYLKMTSAIRYLGRTFTHLSISVIDS